MQAQNVLLLVLAGGLLFLLFNRTRKQQRDAANLQATVTEGARIMTPSGLHALVVGLDDTTMTLETGPGQRSRWDRRAIARVLTDEGTTDEGTDEAPADDAAAEPDTDDIPQTTQDGSAAPVASSQDVAPPDRA
jgi:preprotein translocase subunit YajC